jgi:hypothetical protein
MPISTTLGWVAAVGVLIVCPARPAPAAERDDRVVRYRDSSLSVRLTDVPVADLLNEIARATGAVIVGRARRSGTVTAEFEDVPLPEALARLLGASSFTLTYANGAQPSTIHLLDSDGTETAGAVAPSQGASRTAEPSAGDLAQLLHAAPPIKLGKSLQRVVGQDSASLARIGQVLLESDDANARAEALGLVRQSIAADPALRARIEQVLAAMNDDVLVETIRRVGKDQARELASAIADPSVSPALRARAAMLLERLPAQGASTPPHE